MSTDPVAKLFYGYVEPRSEDDWYGDEDDDEEETAWDKAHTARAHGCIGGIYGYDSNLGNFLAVEASLHKAAWAKIKRLTAQDFEIKPEWNEQLSQAAQHFGIDVAGLTPGWYLVSLYF